MRTYFFDVVCVAVLCVVLTLLFQRLSAWRSMSPWYKGLSFTRNFLAVSVFRYLLPDFLSSPREVTASSRTSVARGSALMARAISPAIFGVFR